MFKQVATRMAEVKSSTTDQPARRARRGLQRFRWWEKKRGSRQTGSSWWGAAGETLFFATLFLVGVATLTQLVWFRVTERGDGFLTSHWGSLLSILLLGSFIIIGAVGAIRSVVITGTSAERRAAIAKRATHSELLREVHPSAEYPSIPNDTNWKNSPGIRLAYRLPSATSPSWRLVVVASFCMIWNGAVAVLAVLAFHEGDRFSGWSFFDPGAWSLFRCVVVIYAVIGLVTTRSLFRMLFAAATIGPTSVEISSLPLYPGEAYHVFLSQAGHLKINWLELRLVCDEEVSFSDGTDTREEVSRVYDEGVFRVEDIEILPSQAFQYECSLRVPEAAMHSFVAAHNAVTWKLIARLQPQPSAPKRDSWSQQMQRSMKVLLRKLPFSKPPSKKLKIVERVYPLVLHPKLARPVHR